jgi:hypothetical protein
MLVSSKKRLFIIVCVCVSFYLISKAINLCAALKIWKYSFLALDEVEVGHPCSKL